METSTVETGTEERAERGFGTSLTNPGESATLRRDRRYLVECQFGARFAGLEHNRWVVPEDPKKKPGYQKEIIEVDTSETYLYNDTGRDATLKLKWKDPADDGRVRVVKLSS